MYSEEDLDSAVAAGVMSAETAHAFRAHVAEQRLTVAVDEEHVRLLGGFNDIFVVIACLLLLLAVNWIGSEVAGWLGTALLAATAWGLAEFFVLKRRMALPAIALLLAFVGGVYLTGVALVEPLSQGYAIVVAGGLATVAAWLHWRRFKVPITVAAGAAALSALVVGAILQAIPAARPWSLPLIFLAGLAIFALAMRWDFSDRERETGRSDVAFWLHLLAAPMLIHPVFSLAAHGGEPSLGQALLVVALYILIAVVSLLIDRRALMVSALGYVLYAFSSLLKVYGVVSLGFAFTALAIGTLLLLLSAFWHTARQGVVARMPEGWQGRLPPLK